MQRDARRRVRKASAKDESLGDMRRVTPAKNYLVQGTDTGIDFTLQVKYHTYLPRMVRYVARQVQSTRAGIYLADLCSQPVVVVRISALHSTSKALNLAGTNVSEDAGRNRSHNSLHLTMIETAKAIHSIPV